MEALPVRQGPPTPPQPSDEDLATEMVDFLATQRHGARVMEIATSCGAMAPQVLRVLRALADDGMVVGDVEQPDGEWWLG